MSEKVLVSLIRAGEGSIDEAVNRAIDLVNGLSNLNGKKIVSIKPNLCGIKSSTSGQTTDPRIIEAIVKKLNSTLPNLRIFIVESNNSQATADQTFERLGYADIAKRYSNVECRNLSKDKVVKVNLNGEIFSTLKVPETLLFTDYLINVAKLKTHMDYYYTGVLKNAYGFLLRRSARPAYHGFMKQALADLNIFYKPDLCLIDGVVGMEGPGPTDGYPKPMGVIIASKDPVAADTIGATVMGINPSKIRYLKYAEKKGIGTSKNIQVVGCKIEEVQTKFKFIPMKYYYLGRFALDIQHFSRRCLNLAKLLSMARSGLSMVGFSTVTKRLSYIELFRMIKNTAFKMEG